jgi:hypothetical protein
MPLVDELMPVLEVEAEAQDEAFGYCSVQNVAAQSGTPARPPAGTRQAVTGHLGGNSSWLHDGGWHRKCSNISDVDGVWC